MAEGSGTEEVKKHVEVLAEKLRGQVRISVKEKTWERVDEDLRWAGIFKLSTGENFNLQGLAAVLKRAWRMPKGARFMEVPGSMVMIKFDSEDKMTRVLEGGPWTFDGAAVLIHRWVAGCNKEELEFNKLRVWVQIHNLPEELLADEAVEEIAGVAGKVTKKMPPENEIMRKRYERFQIEINIHEALVSGCYVEGRNGKDIWIQFKYERLPTFCKQCGLVDHDATRCPKGGVENNYGKWLRAESEERWEPVEEEPLVEEEKSDEEDEVGPIPNEREEWTVAKMWEICDTAPGTRSTLQAEEGIEAMKGIGQTNVTIVGEGQSRGKGVAREIAGSERNENMIVDQETGPYVVGREMVVGRHISGPNEKRKYMDDGSKGLEKKKSEKKKGIGISHREMKMAATKSKSKRMKRNKAGEIIGETMRWSEETEDQPLQNLISAAIAQRSCRKP